MTAKKRKLFLSFSWQQQQQDFSKEKRPITVPTKRQIRTFPSG